MLSVNIPAKASIVQAFDFTSAAKKSGVTFSEYIRTLIISPVLKHSSSQHQPTRFVDVHKKLVENRCLVDSGPMY